MKNLLWFAAGAGVVYLLLMNRKKKSCGCKDAATAAALVAAQVKPVDNTPPNILKNRETFQSMRGYFNSEEASTVAPSINATKPGIF